MAVKLSCVNFRRERNHAYHLKWPIDDIQTLALRQNIHLSAPKKWRGDSGNANMIYVPWRVWLYIIHFDLIIHQITEINLLRQHADAFSGVVTRFSTLRRHGIHMRQWTGSWLFQVMGKRHVDKLSFIVTYFNTLRHRTHIWIGKLVNHLYKCMAPRHRLNQCRLSIN